MPFNYQNFASLGVNLNRQAYGPLDISQVFISEADLNYYKSKGAITEGVSEYWYKSSDEKIVPYPYPGQIVALVGADRSVQILKLTENAGGTFDSSEVGKVPLGDDATIDVTADGVISIKGFAEAANNAQLTKNASGELEWIVPDNSTVSGLQTTVGQLQTNVETLQTNVSDLQEDVSNLESSVGVAGNGDDVPATGLFKEIDDLETKVDGHIANKENPHSVTAAQVGLGNVTNDAQVKRSEMGVASGVATLDATGHVPAAQLPSFVDDVIEVETYEALQAINPGEAGKIYVVTTGAEANKTYRWSGSQYTIISDSIALGETEGTAYEGNKGKANADAITLLNGSDATPGSVANTVKTAIEALDVEDTAVSHQFVTQVVETNGKIAVSRAALVADDIPELPTSKITGLDNSLSEKALASDLDALEAIVGNEEEGTGIFEKIENLSGVAGGLGALASKDQISKTDLDAALTEELNGKVNASDTGDIISHNASEFATAAQGTKADTAIQTVKVNGNNLAAEGNAVNILIAESTSNGNILVNNLDVPVHGLGSAAYTNTDAYATADHNHDTNYAAKSLEATVSNHTGNTDIHVTSEKKTSWDTAASKAAANEAAITTLNGKSSVSGSVDNKIQTAITNLNLSTNYASAAQGALADSAVQNLTILGKGLNKTTNTLTVEEAKTALGLKSAAYEDSTAFDTKGSAASAETNAKAYADGKLTEAKSYADEKVSTLNSTLKNVAKSGAASDVTIVDTADQITATNVEDALAELASAVKTTSTTSVVKVVEASASADYAKVYDIQQNNVSVGKINIPKDLVVESGSVVTLDETDEEGHQPGTYIKLVLANTDGSAIWINVADLIEYVTGGATAEITVSVDPTTHVATATLNDGSIAKSKLDSGVQASLNKADSAVQSLTILGQTLSSTSTSLTVETARTQLGLKSAAYVDTTAFDAAGSADSALADALAADEKVVVKQYTGFSADADEAVSFTVTGIAPDSGYSFVASSLAKIIVNGVVYTATASSSMTVNAGFGLETTDEVFVEFREVKTAG